MEEDREVEGTCSGALAKSPIITSKLDWAGGSLRGTGAQQKMKRRAEIRVKSPRPPLPPAPSAASLCPSPLPLCHLPVLTSLIASLSSPSLLLPSPSAYLCLSHLAAPDSEPI